MSFETRDHVWEKVINALAAHPLGALVGPERMARLIGLNSLWRAYSSLAPGVEDFDARLLKALDIHWQVRGGDIGSIPSDGPLLVVGNHPSGGAEGLVAHAILAARRDDWRVIGNRLLSVVPEISARQIGVFQGGGNPLVLVEAARHLRAGGALLMFPAGTVAHWRVGKGYGEAPWHPSATGLARITGAVVQPLHFTVRTTLRWKFLSAVSRVARTALLPRELGDLRGETVLVDISAPLSDPRAAVNWFARRQRDDSRQLR